VQGATDVPVKARERAGAEKRRNVAETEGARRGAAKTSASVFVIFYDDKIKNMISGPSARTMWVG
jgi:hypothetical protein